MRSRERSLALLLLALAAAIALVVPGWAATAPKTTRVSVSSAGAEAKGFSFSPSISADGRFVAFVSDAANLVPGDRNRVPDVFVRDRGTGKTTRVSVSSTGAEANLDSLIQVQPSISASGRFVAFVSRASNLVPADNNGYEDVFVRDRRAGKTTRVSVSSAGAEANSTYYRPPNPRISAGGRFVAYDSYASNLVPGDFNGASDVFVRDRRAGKTTRVSVSSAGAEAKGFSISPSISAGGRFVAFDSTASNLVPGDSNGYGDVFVRDRRRGKTTRVSVSSAGAEANSASFSPSISAGGRFVGFVSEASNLVPGDFNGAPDLFVRDRRTGKTTQVSVSSAGSAANGASRSPSISADGRFVAFVSGASNLVPGDRNRVPDVFVRDRRTGKTTRVSVSSAAAEANRASFTPAISAAGGFVAFASRAANLVRGDRNGHPDVFVRGPLRTGSGAARSGSR